MLSHLTQPRSHQFTGVDLHASQNILTSRIQLRFVEMTATSGEERGQLALLLVASRLLLVVFRLKYRRAVVTSKKCPQNQIHVCQAHLRSRMTQAGAVSCFLLRTTRVSQQLILQLLQLILQLQMSSQTAALKAWIKVLEGKVALLRQQNKLLCKEVQKINGPKLSSVRDG